MTQQTPIRKEAWFKSKWRPAMAWVYMATILFDFILAPIGWAWVQIIGEGIVAQQWVPLTLGQGGLFHLAMGAILGVAAWSRGREKMVGVAGDSYPPYFGGGNGPTVYAESEYEEQYPINENRGGP